MPVFFLVLIGAILTGQLLDRLQSWRVFIRIEELFILVPILLNLKGNLEMNLAARFSTSAQIGELDLRRTRRALVLGNLALLQVQALIVSLISGLLAFLLGLASRNGVHHGLQHPFHKGMIGTDDQGNDLRGGYFEALLVLCVSMLAASISSGVLGSFMCGLVVLCRRFKVNPGELLFLPVKARGPSGLPSSLDALSADNVSTPIAAVLGDVVTLVILGGLASLFAKFMGARSNRQMLLSVRRRKLTKTDGNLHAGTIISTLVFLCLVVAIVVNLYITFRNAYVQELLSVGWAPLFIAMAISSYVPSFALRLLWLILHCECTEGPESCSRRTSTPTRDSRSLRPSLRPCRPRPRPSLSRAPRRSSTRRHPISPSLRQTRIKRSTRARKIAARRVEARARGEPSRSGSRGSCWARVEHSLWRWRGCSGGRRVRSRGTGSSGLPTRLSLACR